MFISGLDFVSVDLRGHLVYECLIFLPSGIIPLINENWHKLDVSEF